ncbi:MAG: multidrug DMT transporter permease [Legionellaceae bacterium]|nr:multidrug DMT transporter permease [Legionellaceae bacterium]
MHRIAFFLYSILLFSNPVFAFNSACSGQKCIGVVDVGSTGSRLHIYAYPRQDDVHQIQEVWVKKITPGFAMLNPDQSHVDNYLQELFEGAPEDFPIYFYASAGMRLLPSEQQKKYFDIVQSWFQHSSWHLEEARTVTGREEGVFAWLSVHEQLRRIPDFEIPEHLSVMDMGGASVQVVSAVDFKSSENKDDYIDIELHGKKQTLFVRSFLGLGQTLVIDQYLNEASCFPEGYPLPNGDIGVGNARACAHQVSKLIDGVHNVHHVLHPALYPESSRVWYVIEGLAYLAKEKPFNQNEDAITNDGLLEQAEKAVCHRSWEAIQQDYPEENNLSRACLTASYYHALMSAYGIAPSEPVRFVPSLSNVDWTLGVVLQKH